MEFKEVPLEKPTNEVELPSDVKQIRSHLHLSQSAFAAFMVVSIKTLQV